MVTLDERADGTRITVSAGAELALRLEENPTTGFRWQLEEAGAPALTAAGDRYEAPPGARPGAPGRHLWRFRAAAAGTGVVRLSYRRRQGEAARAFSVAVQVR